MKARSLRASHEPRGTGPVHGMMTMTKLAGQGGLEAAAGSLLSYPSFSQPPPEKH